MNKEDDIRVVGGREKNLKGVHVTIPKKQITVFVGVSGSGKSALVFDTIAAAIQRIVLQLHPQPAPSLWATGGGCH